MSTYDDDEDIDLNPHKPKLPPLPPAPDGMIWHGVHPNVRLITWEELRQHISETLDAQVQKQKGRNNTRSD